MRIDTFNPTSRAFKRVQICSTGCTETNGEVRVIGIINAGEVIESKRLVENVIAAIKASGAVAHIYNVPVFGHVNKIDPMTAKYADNFRDVACRNTTAIIKTNLLDGVVIVSDCDVTTAGVLEGCITTNTPTVVMPLGVYAKYDWQNTDFVPRHQSTFFCLLEKLGFTAEGASVNRRGGNAQMAAAYETGKLAATVTTEMQLPKKLFTKTSLQDVVDFCVKSGYALDGLRLLAKLFRASEIKPSVDYLAERLEALSKKGELECEVITKRLSGTALGGNAFIQTRTRAVFAGNAWVYQTLEEADNALCGGAIPPQSVIVLQNCEGVDVTAIANTIVGLNRVGDTAIATDGVCAVTDALVVQLCTPGSGANEEFANIQNGDALKIDVKEGRFNSNVLAKDLKNRAKRNTVRKTPIYF